MPTFPSSIKLTVKDKATAAFKRINKAVQPLQNSFRKVNNRFATFQKRTEGMRKGLRKASGGFKRTGVAMTAGLTAPIGLFGKSVFDATLNFDKAMNNVKAKASFAESGVTKSFAQMEEQAKMLGSTTQFSASEAAQAMGFLAQAGFDTTQIYSALPGVLDLAAASGNDLARTADVASNIMGAFSLESKDMTRVADVMAATMAGSNVDMDQLADTMKFAAPVAKQFGLSLEETSAAAGLLGNIGIQGTNAGTALKNAFLGLAAPTSQANKLLAGLGVQTADKNGKLRGFTEIMADLGKSLKNVGQADQLATLKAVFGKIGIAGASGLIEQATNGELDKFNKKLDNAEGSAKRMAKTLRGGAVGSVTRFKSAFEGLQIAIGKSGLVEFVAKIAEKMTVWFNNISKTNPALLKWGTILLGVAAALGPIIALVGVALGGFATMITAFGGLAAVGGALATAFGFLLTTVLPIVLAVGALGFAAKTLIENWGAVEFFFNEMWDGIGNSFKRGVNNVLGLIPDFIKKKIGLGGFSASIENEKVNAAGRNTTNQNLIKAEDTQRSIDGFVGGIIDSAKSAVGFGGETTINKNQNSAVILDFKNVPAGTKVDTSKVKDKNISANLGFQGGTL